MELSGKRIVQPQGRCSSMTSFLRRHLSYANVTATMALLFAMSGSALAASKEFTAEPKSREFSYVITSINQLSPNVRAKLTAGKPGRTGPAGAPGARRCNRIPGAGRPLWRGGDPGRRRTAGRTRHARRAGHRGRTRRAGRTRPVGSFKI